MDSVDKSSCYYEDINMGDDFPKKFSDTNNFCVGLLVALSQTLLDPSPRRPGPPWFHQGSTEEDSDGGEESSKTSMVSSHQFGLGENMSLHGFLNVAFGCFGGQI